VKVTGFADRATAEAAIFSSLARAAK